MFDESRAWLRRRLADPEARLLAAVVIGSVAGLWLLGGILTPALVALGLAYLLEGVVARLTRRGVRRGVAVAAVFVAFLGAAALLVGVLVPTLYTQLAALLHELPDWADRARAAIDRLPERYPDAISQEEADAFLRATKERLAEAGGKLLGGALSAIRVAIALVVYGVLVPFLVLFFLKDKERILSWLAGRLPRRRAALAAMWADVDHQIGNYIRGKAIEIVIVGAAAFAMFRAFDLRFAVLLAVVVGLSVLIPYVGAAVATLPILAVGWRQFGLEPELLWLLVSYGALQALDGNVLAPLLMSEAVHLHPIVIILALLVFGGMFGVLGAFFAIPLATVVHALFKAWPRTGSPGLEPSGAGPSDGADLGGGAVSGTGGADGRR